MAEKVKGTWVFEKGEKFEHVTVVDPKRIDKLYILVRCNHCGKEFKALARRIKGKQAIKGCPDCSKNFITGRTKTPDLKPGYRSGKLVVVKKLDKKKYDDRIYKCRCDCGNYTEVKHYNLKTKRILSCGCLTEENRELYVEARNGIAYKTLFQKRSNKNNKSTGIKNIYFVKSRNEYLVRVTFKKKLIANKYFGNLVDAKKYKNEVFNKINPEINKASERTEKELENKRKRDRK